MTREELDLIEQHMRDDGLWHPAGTFARLIAGLRAAWAERDVFRCEAEKAHKYLVVYREMVDATVAHQTAELYGDTDVMPRTSDRCWKAYMALRATGWLPESERPKGSP